MADAAQGFENGSFLNALSAFAKIAEELPEDKVNELKKNPNFRKLLDFSNKGIHFFNNADKTMNALDSTTSKLESLLANADLGKVLGSGAKGFVSDATKATGKETTAILRQQLDEITPFVKTVLNGEFLNFAESLRNSPEFTPITEKLDDLTRTVSEFRPFFQTIASQVLTDAENAHAMLDKMAAA